MADSKQVNEASWVTDVMTVEDGALVIDMPREILEALALKKGESLLWTLLPNQLGFVVNKVGNFLDDLKDGVA